MRRNSFLLFLLPFFFLAVSITIVNQNRFFTKVVNPNIQKTNFAETQKLIRNNVGHTKNLLSSKVNSKKMPKIPIGGILKFARKSSQMAIAPGKEELLAIDVKLKNFASELGPEVDLAKVRKFFEGIADRLEKMSIFKEIIKSLRD